MRMIPFSTSDMAKPRISENLKTDKQLDVSKSEFKKDFDQKVNSKLEESSTQKSSAQESNDSVNNSNKEEISKKEEPKKVDNNESKQDEISNESDKNTKKLKDVAKLDTNVVKNSDKLSEKINSSDLGNKFKEVSKKSVKKLDSLAKKEELKKEDLKNKLSKNEGVDAEALVDAKIEIKETPKKVKDIDSSEIKVSELESENSKKIIDPTTKADIKVNDKISDKLTDKLSKKIEGKKNNSESKDKPKLKVSDLRKDIVNEKVDEKNIKIDPNKTVENEKPQDSNMESTSDKTITLGSTELTAEGDGGKAQAPVLKEASTLLKQQLKDFGNNEIVKQTRFILKDKNVGEIKLILKPEALGEVKINLNLKQNSLAGHIVVENSSVREVFQENISSLTKALQDQGYDNADLELSLSDKGQQQEREQQKKENKQYFSERLKRLDESGSTVRYGLATAGINLTA